MSKKRSQEEDHTQRPPTEKDEMGEFEDMWEDEFSSEDEVASPHSTKEAQDDEDMDVDVDQENIDKETYLPGQEIGEDEVLVADLSVYEMLHSMNMEWPCLSFDFLRDSLGQDRRSFPKTLYYATGSQAEKSKDKLYVLKMSQLYKTKDTSSDTSSDDEDAIDEDPIVEWKSIPHSGGVNRIRTMPHPTAHIVATWSDAKRVNVFDVSDLVECLDSPGKVQEKKDRLLYSLKHVEEGFALDWSRVTLGNLVTGDLTGEIFLTTTTESTFSTDSKPFQGHESSVEDLQWSPSEKTVFASCSSDCSIRIWDTRAKKRRAQVTLEKAHSQDVNVLSWNRCTDHLLASGSDDGTFSVWDLRSFVSSSKPEPAATFKWHKDAITSVEWHPTEASVLGVSGADDQVTLWDLSVERDPEEEKEVLGKTGSEALGLDVPPQLMFVHQGQKNVKEIHWHPQLPGVIASTAEDGFNVFQTINI